MKLHVAGTEITVVVEQDVRDDYGSATYGLFRSGSMQIVLDASMPPAERRHTLMHELGHAFEHLLGRVDPTDDEGRQQRLASIDRQFNADLARYGGEAGIHALFGDRQDATPVGFDGSFVRTAATDEEASWPTNVCCSRCHTSYPSSAVRNGFPDFDARINSYVLWRVLACGKCGYEQRWRQRCTYEGLPIPSVVTPPTFKALQPV